MYHACSATDSSLNNCLVGILLSLHLHILIDSDGAKPIVRVVTASGGLTVYSHALHIFQQLFIKSLHVLVMCNMVIHHRHLATSNTSANVRHTVVITYFLMLVVWIALAILRSIHHNLPPRILIWSNQRTTTRCSNHLVTIKRKYTILTKRTQHLTIELRSESLSSILYHWNAILISDSHNLVNLVGHAVECYWHNGLWILSRFLLTVDNRFLQQFRIHVPCLVLRVNEHRCCPKIRDGM